MKLVTTTESYSTTRIRKLEQTSIVVRLDKTMKEAATTALEGRSMSFFIRQQLNKLIEGGIYEDRSFSRKTLDQLS